MLTACASLLFFSSEAINLPSAVHLIFLTWRQDVEAIQKSVFDPNTAGGVWSWTQILAWRVRIHLIAYFLIFKMSLAKRELMVESDSQTKVRVWEGQLALSIFTLVSSGPYAWIIWHPSIQKYLFEILVWETALFVWTPKDVQSLNCGNQGPWILFCLVQLVS